MKITKNLWSKRYSVARGWYWKYERDVTDFSADGWVEIYEKDEPNVEFRVSVQKPRT